MRSNKNEGVMSERACLERATHSNSTYTGMTETRHNSNVAPARKAFSTYSLRNLYGRPYPPRDPVAYSSTMMSMKWTLLLAEDDAS